MILMNGAISFDDDTFADETESFGDTSEDQCGKVKNAKRETRFLYSGISRSFPFSGRAKKASGSMQMQRSSIPEAKR